MEKFNIRKIEGYTIMSNHHLRDQNLSHSARGLLSFLLSLPENWDYSFNGLVAISKEGKDAVRSMINELKEAKYIKISQYRDEKGWFKSKYDVYEYPYDMTLKMTNYRTPAFPVPDKPMSDEPIPDKPMMENPPQIINKEINNKETITKKINNKENNKAMQGLSKALNENNIESKDKTLIDEDLLNYEWWKHDDDYEL